MEKGEQVDRQPQERKHVDFALQALDEGHAQIRACYTRQTRSMLRSRSELNFSSSCCVTRSWLGISYAGTEVGFRPRLTSDLMAPVGSPLRYTAILNRKRPIKSLEDERLLNRTYLSSSCCRAYWDARF